MYLSKLTLNSCNRQVKRELVDPYQMHRTLSTCCFDAQAISAQRNVARGSEQAKAMGAYGLLFRPELIPDRDTLIVIAQSYVRPNWDGLPPGYALQVEGPKDFDLTNKLTVGQVCEFRLRANPTKREPAHCPGEKRDGKRKPIFGEEAQIDWLVKKGLLNGFEVVRESLKRHDDDILKSIKIDKYGKKHDIPCLSVRFEGNLRVIDVQLLHYAVMYGLGKSKGNGFGLLSLSPFAHQSSIANRQS